MDAKTGALGRQYRDGEVIVRQGEVGDCMYVVQEGRVEILVDREGEQVRLRVCGKGEIIGEMAIFEREARSATARALGEARLLTVDKRNFLRRIREDPSLAFHITETMAHRIRNLSERLARFENAGIEEDG